MTRFFTTMMGVVLSGCAQPAVVIQLYDVGSQAAIGKAVESFATDHGVELQRPPVAPASTEAEVAVVSGSQWHAASMASALAEQLYDLGARNIVVTNNHS